MELNLLKFWAPSRKSVHALTSSARLSGTNPRVPAPGRPYNVLLGGVAPSCPEATFPSLTDPYAWIYQARTISSRPCGGGSGTVQPCGCISGSLTPCSNCQPLLMAAPCALLGVSPMLWKSLPPGFAQASTSGPPSPSLSLQRPWWSWSYI